jgi:hypothetical protein
MLLLPCACLFSVLFRSISQGCCHVSVSYSSLPELRITTPSAKARDFLAESTGGPGAVTHASGAVVNPAAAAASMQQQMQQAQQAAMAGYPMDPMNPFAQQMAAAAAAAAASGMNPFAQQMAAAAAAAAGQGQGGAGAQPNPYAHMAGQMGFGFPGAMQFAAGQGGVQNAAASSSGGAGAGAGGSSGGPGCVLLASNLPLNIKPEEIFKLFGVYGDVMRVKILFNRRDSALVQFKDAEGCRSAITHLNQAPLASGPGAKAMHVSASVHNDISMPKAPAEGDAAGQQQQAEQLTADFSQSKIHRFRNKPAGGKNVFAPSQVLHVGNLPVGTTEEQLQQLFGPTHTTTSCTRTCTRTCIGNCSRSCSRTRLLLAAVSRCCLRSHPDCASAVHFTFIRPHCMSHSHASPPSVSLCACLDPSAALIPASVPVPALDLALDLDSTRCSSLSLLSSCCCSYPNPPWSRSWSLPWSPPRPLTATVSMAPCHLSNSPRSLPDLPSLSLAG